MAVGSTYSTLKGAIYAKLLARLTPLNVVVRYSAPERTDDVLGPTGKYEAVWLDNAMGSQDNVVICGAPLSIDETYRLNLSVQVLQEDGNVGGTQQTADVRCDEILYEVMDELAGNPTWGVTQFPICQTTRATFKWETGVLPNGMGHGARVDLALEAKGRISYA